MTGPETLLRELIALPSVNPAFAPLGSTYAGEQRVAEFLAETTRRAGLDTELQPVLPGRPNLVARLAPTGTARHRLLLAPHMDTVGVAHDKQFSPITKGSRLFGRGACDTKGSVAAMLAALIELAHSPQRPTQTEIWFTAFMDEECNQAGSRAFAKRSPRADLAIVGEPTRLRVVTAHKGDLWLKLETRGRAAHGATPHLGRNAVHEMARAVTLLETNYARQLRRKRHPVLGHATINVGTIAGGRQPNIVPDACAIQIDRRTLPSERDNAVRREIVRFLGGHGIRVALADTREGMPAPSLETRADLPWVSAMLRLARQRGPMGVDYFTDAGVLSAAGVPSVVFGPGDIAQAHTADEWIDVRQLQRAKDLLVRFLQSLP